LQSGVDLEIDDSDRALDLFAPA
jgi:hypothetical protein